jgi:hypothetical protein
VELRRDGWIGEDETVVVFNTGSGLLYEDSLPGRAPSALAAGERIEALSSARGSGGGA